MTDHRPFSVHETHGILVRTGCRARVGSDAQQWGAIYASSQQELPFDGVFGSVEDQLLVLHRSGPAYVSTDDGAHNVTRVVPQDGIYLHSGGRPFGVSLESPIETTHVYLRRSVMAEVAEEMQIGALSQIEIPCRLVEHDVLLSSLMRSVHDALLQPRHEDSYWADYMARAIASRLLARYSRRPSQLSESAPRGAVAKAIAVMRARLDEQITLSDLAEATGLSTSSIGKKFRESTGYTPHGFLTKLRVERACDMLANTNTAIAVIALECGFCHQEHMTRVFKSYAGTTPAAYRRHGIDEAGSKTLHARQPWGRN